MTNRKALISAVLLSVGSLLFSPLTPAAGKALPEYRVKAAFLLNFARFIHWPEDAIPDGNINLCVLGENPFGDELSKFDGKSIASHTLNVEYIPAPDAAGQCHVLYVKSIDSKPVQQFIKSLAGRPVLTVSDADTFTRNGGIIRLMLVNKRVRFEINTDAASRAHLDISSKLLRLALIVTDSGLAED